MDLRKILVFVKEVDKTEEIDHIHYDLENGKVNITFQHNHTIYSFNQDNVVVFKKPKVIELNGYAAYVKGVPVYEPQPILDFGEWIRIIQYNNKSFTVQSQLFSMFKDGAVNQNFQQIPAYLKDISQYTSDEPNDEAFLKREIRVVSFSHSALI